MLYCVFVLLVLSFGWVTYIFHGPRDWIKSSFIPSRFAPFSTVDGTALEFAGEVQERVQTTVSPLSLPPRDLPQTVRRPVLDVHASNHVQYRLNIQQAAGWLRCKRAAVSGVVLGLGPWLSLRTTFHPWSWLLPWKLSPWSCLSCTWPLGLSPCSWPWLWKSSPWSSPSCPWPSGLNPWSCSWPRGLSLWSWLWLWGLSPWSWP